MISIYSNTLRFCVLFTVWVSTAWGNDMGANLGWHDQARGLLISRLNPDVLILEMAKGERLDYHYSTALDMVDGSFEYAGAVRLSPASGSALLKLQWLPVAFFKLNSEAEWGRYYGNFSNVLLFDGADADYSDERRETLEDDAQAAWFSRYKLEGVLRAKVGPVVARYSAAQEYFDYDVNDQGRFIYEPSYDLLIQNQDTVDISKLELFYAFPSVAAGKRLVGLFFESNESDSANIQQEKLGLQSLWGQRTFEHDVLWVGQLAKHIDSRYRENEWMLTLGIIKPF